MLTYCLHFNIFKLKKVFSFQMMSNEFVLVCLLLIAEHEIQQA